MNKEYLDVRSDVADALQMGAAVVALESTIIAHGMPYPQNVETALAVEEIIRDAGALPATLAVLDGRLKAGLTRDEIERVATEPGLLKAGDRDIPFVLAQKGSAATTVSASLAIASAAGIKVFVTGGIGGVGPEGYRTLDISADLSALAEYRCITVCAGAKAFMDIPATLEYLETHRVSVVGFQTDTFPLFYTQGSTFKLDWRAESADQVAEIFMVKTKGDVLGGLLLGVPLAENEALSMQETRQAIDQALQQIEALGITGKGVTPFILDSIKKTTHGRSLTANIALVKNNAKVGAEIAVALARRLTSLRRF